MLSPTALNPYEILRARALSTPQKVGAFTLRMGGQTLSDFQEVTWKEIFNRLKCCGQFLRSLGLERGDRIAIQARNGIEWVILDWAAISSGYVTVPIYTQSHMDEVRLILEDSGAKVFFCDKMIDQVSIDQILMEDLERSVSKLDGTYAPSPLPADETTTIVYTSGTSGRPKGVMHSLFNIQSAFFTANPFLQMGPNDRLISYLPLSHVVERMIVEFGMLYTGANIYFLDRVERLVKELARVRPTIFMSVPRIWDMIRFKISKEIEVAEKSPLMRNTPQFLKKILIGRSVRSKLGFDRTRFCLSGAAKLSLETFSAFQEWGIEIHEGYGLTETLCMSTVNPPEERPQLGSVGKVYPGVQIKLAADGEICLKAPFHFLGYFGQPEATAEVIKDGWFMTGDIGEFDARRNLKITDRKKDLFKTSNGKYVAPSKLENLMKGHPAVKEIMIVGDGQAHCVAIASVDPDIAEESSLMKWVETVNLQLAPHEHIKALGCFYRSWTTASGELTASLKLKRKVVLERYQKEIQDLFDTRARIKFFEEKEIKLENQIRAHLSV